MQNMCTLYSMRTELLYTCHATMVSFPLNKNTANNFVMQFFFYYYYSEMEGHYLSGRAVWQTRLGPKCRTLHPSCHLQGSLV